MLYSTQLKVKQGAVCCHNKAFSFFKLYLRQKLQMREMSNWEECQGCHHNYL